MSTSSRRKQAIELSSFHSSFLADDTLVLMVPSFNYPNRIPLMSCSSPVGPFRAGIATHVPVWFAQMLQQKSLCTLQVPEWLQTEHLTQVKQYETTEGGLTPSEEQQQDNNAGTATATLPFYYYELGQRFTSSKTTGSSSTAALQASNLVLQDVAQIRLDKIRQQFQQVSGEQFYNPNLCLAITGIASTELVQMKALMEQALNDQRFLATGRTKEEDAKQQQQQQEKQQQQRKNATSNKILLYDEEEQEKEKVPMEEDDDEEEQESITTGSTLKPRNNLRSRTRRLRR